jgi:hypothetical protein
MTKNEKELQEVLRRIQWQESLKADWLFAFRQISYSEYHAMKYHYRPSLTVVRAKGPKTSVDTMVNIQVGTENKMANNSPFGDFQCVNVTPQSSQVGRGHIIA